MSFKLIKHKKITSLQKTGGGANIRRMILFTTELFGQKRKIEEATPSETSPCSLIHTCTLSAAACSARVVCCTAGVFGDD